MRYVAVLIIVLYLCGCSSLIRTAVEPDVYTGTNQCVKHLNEPVNWSHGGDAEALFRFCVVSVDILPSFVLDSVFLPYTGIVVPIVFHPDWCGCPSLFCKNTNRQNYAAKN